MATGFDCPTCFKRYSESEDLVDYLIHPIISPINFVCDECGSSYDIEIEFEPYFFIYRDTIKKKEKTCKT
jgi:hypothetical protein